MRGLFAPAAPVIQYQILYTPFLAKVPEVYVTSDWSEACQFLKHILNSNAAVFGFKQVILHDKQAITATKIALKRWLGGLEPND